jgi:hypothetical protein
VDDSTVVQSPECHGQRHEDGRGLPRSELRPFPGEPAQGAARTPREDQGGPTVRRGREIDKLDHVRSVTPRQGLDLDHDRLLGDVGPEDLYRGRTSIRSLSQGMREEDIRASTVADLSHQPVSAERVNRHCPSVIAPTPCRIASRMDRGCRAPDSTVQKGMWRAGCHVDFSRDRLRRRGAKRQLRAVLGSP